jgi:multidrug efflux system membrane fusion protein
LVRTRVLISSLSILALLGAACNNNTSAAAPGTAGGGGGGRGRGGRGGGGDAPVVTAKATEKDVAVEIAAIGNVEPFASISIRSQITGLLQEVAFHEGDFVKKGQPLFSLDRRPFEAALAQADANLSRDRALLAQAESQLARDAANAEYQQLSRERQAQLVERGILSKDAGEQARSLADASAAVVKADRANVESARAQLVAQDAAVANAKVQLSYTTITSPIDGRTGNLSVKVGSLVTANQMEMITIARVEPIYVTFAVPAVHLRTISSHIKGAALPVTATPQDGEAQSIPGSLAFFDNTIDMTTDTIKLKATFPNTDHRLWPGQFARVSLRLDTIEKAVLVPGQAVQTGQDGQYVFVVKPDSTVEQRPISIGQRADDAIVVTKGLSVGETVVTEGQLRLEPGVRITTDTGPRGGQGGAGRGRGGRGAAGGSGSTGGGRNRGGTPQ